MMPGQHGGFLPGLDGAVLSAGGRSCAAQSLGGMGMLPQRSMSRWSYRNADPSVLQGYV